MDVLRKSR